MVTREIGTEPHECTLMTSLPYMDNIYKVANK